MEKLRGPEMIGAGFLASLASLLFTYLLLIVAGPGVDPAAVFGSVLAGGSPAAPWTTAWWSGMGWHLINGVVLGPLAFSVLFSSRPNSSFWLRGIVFGTLCWLATEGLVKPLTTEGFFSASSSNPPLIPWLNLFRCSFYGTALSFIAESSTMEEAAWPREEAA